MPRDDAARVRDIIEACDRIMKATAGLDCEAFAGDDLVIRAVLYDFAVIGEAAKGVSPAMRASLASIPWSEMAGMRDVVIHQYFGVDADIKRQPNAAGGARWAVNPARLSASAPDAKRGMGDADDAAGIDARVSRVSTLTFNSPYGTEYPLATYRRARTDRSKC